MRNCQPKPPLRSGLVWQLRIKRTRSAKSLRPPPGQARGRCSLICRTAAVPSFANAAACTSNPNHLILKLFHYNIISALRKLNFRLTLSVFYIFKRLLPSFRITRFKDCNRMAKKPKILCVDDEQDILDLLTFNLEKEGYDVCTALNGRKGLEVAKRELPDLIILDVMMPEMDGMETCREIREIPALQNVVITFLTARNEDYSQIAGFEAGADDFINKPIRQRLLVSKIKALLRRSAPSDLKKEMSIGGIEIDRDKYLVTKDGVHIQLPKKEFELLVLLSSAPGRVFTRENILNSIWGNDVIVGDRTIDVHIRKLREKLGDENFKTIKGVGYKFEA